MHKEELSTEILTAAGRAFCAQCSAEKTERFRCKNTYKCIWKKDKLFTAAEGYGCPTCQHFQRMFVDNLFGTLRINGSR